MSLIEMHKNVLETEAGSSGGARTSDRMAQAIEKQLRYQFGLAAGSAGMNEIFRAAALTVRREAVDGMIETEARYRKANAKRLYYLSMEFLIGRSLGNNLRNLGLYEVLDEALGRLGVRLTDLLEVEPDAALGNGGLGRLAACFLDSLASLGMPGFGYGINYEYGLFKQEIEHGHQKEKPDQWASNESPWMIERKDESVVVPLYGRVEHSIDRRGKYNPMWLDWKVLVGVPHDMPVVGWKSKSVNYLRLYSARSSDDFDIRIFNDGDYLRAVEQKMESETVSKVLYPSDSCAAGKELRLIQEYFLVACSVRDIFRRYFELHSDLANFENQVALQMNDTHPALAVAETMRILVDEHDVPWDRAWRTTVAVCAYTNHTLLPEALEKWPVGLLERVLPRHLQIIYEINQRFLAGVEKRWPGDAARRQRLSLIEEGDGRRVRMANLAIVGSHSINGVAALHSELVKSDLVPDLHQFFPERFNNKTNGVTHRRWVAFSNPELGRFITERIGDGWLRDMRDVQALEGYSTDSASRDEFLRIKRHNKERLARLIAERVGLRVDPDALFDVQVKRIHEYKRQLLHAMHVAHEYLSIVEDGRMPAVARVHVFAGKAAPGYRMAKLIIKFINSLAETVNGDPAVRQALKVAFIPDYKVSLAEVIIPGADVSEQISTAGLEASGTSNMKFAMNGALTVGTLDGANVEMREAAGGEAILIFGLRADEVLRLRASGYSPWDFYHSSPRARRVVDAIRHNRFSPNERGIFEPIWEALLNQGDYYLHLADFDAYVDTEATASGLYGDRCEWGRRTMLAVARMGRFSSDRTVEEYAREIWNLKA